MVGEYFYVFSNNYFATWNMLQNVGVVNNILTFAGFGIIGRICSIAMLIKPPGGGSVGEEEV